MYISLLSSIDFVNSATFLSNSILEYAFFTKYSVFLSHLRSSLIITPKSFAWFTTSSFSSFNFKFAVNLYLSVKLKIITFVFFWFRIQNTEYRICFMARISFLFIFFPLTGLGGGGGQPLSGKFVFFFWTLPLVIRSRY